VAKSSKSNSYHHGNLRAALVTAGLSLIEERGSRGFTLREVARRADVSHAAPYRHFADREALLVAVAADGFAAFDKALSRARREYQGQPGPDEVCALGLAYVTYAVDHPQHYQIMFGDAIGAGARFPDLADAAQKSFGHLLQAISDGQRAGALRRADPKQLALCAWSTVHGLASLAIAERLPDENTLALVATALETLMRGLGAPMPSR